MINTPLELMKYDLGITHTERDDYFLSILESSKKELEGKGIVFDVNSVQDNILIADYAAWNYRKRMENIPLSRNLEFRIRNRIVKNRSTGENE